MRKLLFTMLSLLLLSAQLIAQNRTISGRVTDEKGQPLASISVLLKGTRTGTVTNTEGRFSLVVPLSATVLTFSGVDFQPLDVTIGNQTSLSVKMLQRNSSLDEVVVTGYTREKRTQFTGAASTIKAREIENVPMGAFDQVLQGRAPGLMINSGSGQPGTSARVAIRGTQSISGAFAQPLYIVDGIPLEAAEFASINANDFETVNVLKDASASALYGSRAGQGVIVVTTKRGRAGRTNFTYRTQYGVTQVTPWINFDMMNTRERLLYEERNRINAPGWVYSRNNPNYNILQTGFTSLPQQQARYDALLDSFSKIQNEPLSLLFRQGQSRQHEVNIQGGAENTRYFISGSYFKQEGTELRSRLERYTTRLNLDHRSGKFSFQSSTTVGASINDFSEGEFLGNSARNSFQIAWRGMPYENPFLPNGTLNAGANTGLAPRLFANTLEGIQNTQGRNNQLKINTGLLLTYELVPHLTLQNQFGVDYRNDRWLRWFNPTSIVGGAQQFNRGSNSEAVETSTQIINTTSLTYANTFGSKHEIAGGLYFEALRTWDRILGFTVFGLDPRLPQTGQGAGNAANGFPPNATSAKTGFGIRSYFATARYTYDGKYTVNLAARRDGTSRIVKPENKEIDSWSVGITWNAMKEKFMENQSIFSDLRPRISYGITPNIASIPTTTYSAPLVSIPNYQGAQNPTFGSSTYAGSGIIGLAPTAPGNPELAIENVRKFNVGADMAFLKNRLRFGIDYYINRTFDMFVSQPLPRTSGFTQAQINAGKMSNKGFEFSLSADLVQNNNLTVTVGGNHAINHNLIEDLGVVDEYVAGTFLIKKGLPYGSHYTQRYLGADPATGRPVYEAANGGITSNFAQAARLAAFGSFMPVHTGGATLDIRWKRFNFSTLFSYQFDVTRSNNIDSWTSRGASNYAPAVNQVRRLLTQQWRQPGDVQYYQIYSIDRDFVSSDIMSAAFMRWRNITISYQTPSLNIGGRQIIRSARFYVMAQNVMIWSPWIGPDPEDNNNISLSEFPNPRMLTAGLDINF
jgi:TonB-linked SusC/RagA family outer membrane protein